MEEIIEKSSTMPKKMKEGPFGFFNIYSVGKYQKIEGGTFQKKDSQSRKYSKGVPFGPIEFLR